VDRKEIAANIYVREGHAESLLGRDSSFKLEIIKQVNTVGDNPLKVTVYVKNGKFTIFFP